MHNLLELIKKEQNIYNIIFHELIRQVSLPQYYTDNDRDGHKISRFGGLPRELYFPKVRTEGKYCPEGKYNYLGTTDRHVIFHPSRSISVMLDGQMNDLIKSLWCSMTTTKFGNKTRSLRTKQAEHKNFADVHAFSYDVLLLTTA